MTSNDDQKANLLQQVDAGARAERLLRDTEEILEVLERDAWDTFKMSEGADTEGRQNCYMMTRAIDAFRQELIVRINAGVTATAELKPSNGEDDGGTEPADS